MFRNLIILVGLTLTLASCFNGKPRVLVFSKTTGYRHESIEVGQEAIRKLGLGNGFDVDTTENAASFTEENLKKYKAVVFLSTTGNVLDQAQQNEFMRFIQAGGGYVGIHAAADTEYDWWWYGKLVGAYFKSHPPEQQNANLKKVSSLASNGQDKLPEQWTRKDEWYNYKKISSEIKVLYTLDETSYKGGDNGENHPITWYQEFDGGRSFYTGLGHTKESYTEPEFLTQVLSGIQYAIGDSKLDYSKVKAKHLPEENRFVKTVLGYYFNEPTEMTVFADGRIIFLERKGNVKLYDPKTDSIKVINTFNVNTKFEDGMIGLAQDPNFASNNYLYIFYSHPTRSANILSRFIFKDGKIDMASEKEMLEVGTQRETCCHTGGSLEFDANGNLFISTGDNTSPFESDGFSPSDEGEGRAPFDAQKSSGNTNDLRGKILRIHPEPDGSYTIPDGNLFPKGEEKTRPEIYVMGNRNPYRISIDKKTGWLYWGEVGPDAGNDSDERGPRGYDELNQAKGPGFFGWPYFVGGNFAYAEYDFQKKTVGAKHDPNKPINNSPNNTGKMELPPVSPPFIYYPYAVSPDFPLMKTGGRNAMAGPIYYSENYKGQKEAFPDYFDGKVIIYDWMRNWIRLLTLDAEGRIMDIEPFMDGTQFNNIIDMSFGSDGKLYMIEYGTKWFGENMDARLVRIDYYNSNRAPVPVLKASKVTGAIPFEVTFSAVDTKDPDGDKLNFELMIGENKQSSTTGDFKFNFDQPGVYRPKLTVSDGNGGTSSTELVIIAGNEPPSVSVSVEGNQTYYLSNSSVAYKVGVTDREDGSTADGRIPSDRVRVSVDFMTQGYDSAQVAAGHQKPAHPGKILIAESDCKSCHIINAKSAGPSYQDIAKKYKGNTKAVDILSDKIIKGGSGVWGETPMAAHPQITKENAASMVGYILSLANEAEVKNLPLSGIAKFDAAPKEGVHFQSAYIISAHYDDNGFGIAPSLPGSAIKVLKAPVLTGGIASELSEGISKFEPQGGSIMLNNLKAGSSFKFKDIDLTSVKSMEITVTEIDKRTVGGKIEIYLDSTDGTKLGTIDFASAAKTEVRPGFFSKTGRITFASSEGKHTIIVVCTNGKAQPDDRLFIFNRLTLTK